MANEFNLSQILCDFFFFTKLSLVYINLAGKKKGKDESYQVFTIELHYFKSLTQYQKRKMPNLTK